MSFTESNTVEQMILDAVGKVTGAQPSVVRETPPPGWGDFAVFGLRWSNCMAAAKI